MLNAQGAAVKFELVHTPGNQVRLTITPSRITLKLGSGSGAFDEGRYSEFAIETAGKLYTNGLRSSWRKRVKVVDGLLTAV